MKYLVVRNWSEWRREMQTEHLVAQFYFLKNQIEALQHNKIYIFTIIQIYLFLMTKISERCNGYHVYRKFYILNSSAAI